uniref:Uncharacterized protein n=1 Tax=Strongyloides papillosus TaxID=174720 RepID=A0A0N5C964_STREA
MNRLSLIFFCVFLSILVLTPSSVIGSEIRFPSRDVMKAMLRDPNAYFRGEPIRFGKKSNFREPIRFGKRGLLHTTEKGDLKEMVNVNNENFDGSQFSPIPLYR